MNRIIVVLALVGVLVAAGCSTIHTTYGYNPKTDFSAMRTYDWMPRPNAPVSSDPETARRDEAVDSYIVNCVEEELASKGITRNTSTPDFLITYHGLLQDKVNISDFSRSLSDRLRLWGGVSGNIDVHMNAGTLVLDVVNPRTKVLIWRGAAEGTLDRNISMKEEQKIIRHAVDKLIGDFPPGK